MNMSEAGKEDGPYPVDLERLSAGLIRIHWSDQVAMEYSPGRLRQHCPCATCREKRRSETSEKPKGLPVLSAAETQPLEIASMRPVGQYAYSIAFSDGHNSGIFPFALLREVGEPT